jgi:hypothetical protein
MAFDSTPEIDRLVREIHAGGNYTGEADVITKALRLLRQQVHAQELNRQNSSKPILKKLALIAWAIQVLATITVVVACAIAVHSVLVIGPALTLSGLALALITQPLYSWSVFGYGLSGPLVCSLCALLILAQGWGPNEAEGPIQAISVIYAVISIPIALIVFPKILHWGAWPQPWGRWPWRFSLKSLLLVTTATCLIVPLFRFLLTYSSRGDFIVFSLFAVVTMSLVGVSLAAFMAGRRSH